MADKSLEDRLNEIFANVNNWLKFAEAKNGVLLSINGGAIIAIFSFFRDIPDPVSCSLAFGLVPGFILATLVLLSSFLPMTDNIAKRKFGAKNKNTAEPNLIFYKDIKGLSTNDYLKSLNESVVRFDQQTSTKLEEDITQEIISNSIITWRKLWFFRIGFFCDLAGVLAALSLFLCIYFYEISFPFCQWLESQKV